MRPTAALGVAVLLAALLLPCLPAEAGASVAEGAVAQASVERVAGIDRVATAVAVARESFPETAPAVVLARADDFPDALVAAPLAVALGGPVLLTPSDALHADVVAELARLDPAEVVVLGGTEAIEPQVEADVASRFSVRRVAGADRFETAASIARLLPEGPAAVLATGSDFPDALAVAPYAAASGQPMLLTAGPDLPPPTAAALTARGTTTVTIAGDETAIPAAVADVLERGGAQVRRVAGGSSTATAAALHELGTEAGLDPGRVWLATSTDFPDALTAGAGVATLGESLLLVDGQNVAHDDALVASLRPRLTDLERVVVLGGPAAVDGDVVAALGAALHGPLLPHGGRSALDGQMLAGLYGSPRAPDQGPAGQGTPHEAALAARDLAQSYSRPERGALGVLDLVATVTQRSPGADGDYALDYRDSELRPYLDAARAAGVLLVLDIQPGRTPPLEAVRRWEPLLREPDVAVALDAEWVLGPGDVPGRDVGRISAAEVNEVAAYLSDLVVADDLPEKPLIIHQFLTSSIDAPERIEQWRGVPIVLDFDGEGPRGPKAARYAELAAPPGLHDGIMLFGREPDLLLPDDVLGLEPRPDLVLYQ